MKMSRETSLLASFTHTTTSSVLQGSCAKSLENVWEGLELEQCDARTARGRVAGVQSDGGGFDISSSSLSLNGRNYLMDLDVPVDLRPTSVGSAPTPAVVALTVKERHETVTLERCMGASDVQRSGVATDARHSSVASHVQHSGVASDVRRVPCPGAAEIALPKMGAARSQARVKQVPCPPSRRLSRACACALVCVRACVRVHAIETVLTRRADTGQDLEEEIAMMEAQIREFENGDASTAHTQSCDYISGSPLGEDRASASSSTTGGSGVEVDSATTAARDIAALRCLLMSHEETHTHHPLAATSEGPRYWHTSSNSRSWDHNSQGHAPDDTGSRSNRQLRSFATATDQLTSPDSMGTSSPVSVHHDVGLPRNEIQLTPANLAAALSEVELALEFMNSTPTGVSAPSSWNGRCVCVCL